MDEKVVFISHSSLDADFAQKVCAVMESNNLFCWIAPRDIPYGEHWCKEIVDAISKSKIMLFIFSENSNNKSDQVIREIHQAIQFGVTIIPIRLTTSNYNPSLNYFLSLNHWLQVDETCVSWQLTELARRITLFINDEDYTPDIVFNKYFENLDLAIDESVNIDESFDKSSSNFTIFNTSKTKEKNETATESSFRQKLIQRASEATLNNLFKEENIYKFSCEENVEDSSDTNSSGDTNDSDEKGRYFYCYEEKNIDILAFLVSYIIDEKNYKRILTTEYLDKATEMRENGDKDVCFFIDNPDYEGNPLLLACIDNSKNIVTWCLGFLDDDSLKIAKTPSSSQEITISDDYNKSIVRYAANEHGLIILDLEAHKVVERKRYFDKSSDQWKYYVELLLNNKYIFFKPKFASAESPANPFNIGYGYYKGKYGLRKNVIEAATWFEKAATKEAYYYLAEIFKNDPALKNEDDYKYYTKLYNSKK